MILKKYLLFILCITLTLLLSACSETINDDTVIDSSNSATEYKLIPEQRNDTNFRNTKWGDNRETVIQYETALPATEEKQDDSTSLFFKDSIVGLSTVIVYQFDTEDRLYQALYDFNQNYTNEHNFIVDYNNLKDILIEKYGQPFRNEVIILNIEANQTDAGTALKNGYTLYGTQWETDESSISIVMASEDNKIGTTIFYTSVEIKPVIDTTGF